MGPESHTVVVVLDPQCGERLADLAQRDPVWVVDSPTNRPVVERLWSSPGDTISLTVFDRVEGEAPSATLMRMLDTIDQHHPHCAGYRIHGASATDEVCGELARLGYRHQARTPHGFDASEATPVLPMQRKEPHA